MEKTLQLVSSIPFCYTCKHTESNVPLENVQFYRFPRDTGMRTMWFHALNINLNSYLPDHAAVCSKHFLLSDFEGNSFNLKVTAVPHSLTKPSSRLQDMMKINTVTSSQTSFNISASIVKSNVIHTSLSQSAIESNHDHNKKRAYEVLKSTMEKVTITKKKLQAEKRRLDRKFSSLCNELNFLGERCGITDLTRHVLRNPEEIMENLKFNNQSEKKDAKTTVDPGVLQVEELLKKRLKCLQENQSAKLKRIKDLNFLIKMGNEAV